MEEAKLAWLALALTPRMGPTRSARVVRRLGGAERVFAASLTELEGVGMPAEAAQFCADGRAYSVACAEQQRTTEAGGTFLTPEDVEYPARLLEIYDPPAVLWVRGDTRVLNRAGLAVVGTRHPTPYGAGMAEMLSRDLARRGMVIVSGMARGIDTNAHKGALDAGGVTIAVWGTGIDVVYPKENKRLAEDIVARGGAIVSEFPLGTFPAPQNFPIRNRTLSGMSVGVLVIGGCRVFGNQNHRTLRHRAEPRYLCRSGKRNQQKRLGSQHADQAGSQADGNVGGRVGGPAIAGARRSWNARPKLRLRRRNESSAGWPDRISLLPTAHLELVSEESSDE